MDINVFYGILIPFLGTSAGAACVFFMKKNLNEQIQRALTGLQQELWLRLPYGVC